MNDNSLFLAFATMGSVGEDGLPGPALFTACNTLSTFMNNFHFDHLQLCFSTPLSEQNYQ